jgi:hypothetical protein
MPKLTKLVATIGTAKYCFLGTQGLYTGTNATEVGIAEAPPEDEDLPNYAVKELLLKGLVRRVSAIVLTTGNKRTKIGMLVAKDKLSTALDGLIDNTISIPGGTSGAIKSVGFSRRVTSRG